MQTKPQITLVPLLDQEKESFIHDVQAAFKIAVVKEWGDTGEEVIPRQDIEEAFHAQGAESYHIVHEGRIVGGTVLTPLLCQQMWLSCSRIFQPLSPGARLP